MVGALATLIIAGLVSGLMLKKHKLVSAIAAIVAMIALFAAFPKLPMAPFTQFHVPVPTIWALVAFVIAALVAILLAMKKNVWMMAGIVVAVWAMFLAVPNLSTAFSHLGGNVQTVFTQFFDDVTAETPGSGDGTKPSTPAPTGSTRR